MIGVIRSKIWRRAVKNIPEGPPLPWWALTARAVLYPLDFLFCPLHMVPGYHPVTDTWLIEGVRYSGAAMRWLAQAQGETYRVTRSGDVVPFEWADGGAP